MGHCIFCKIRDGKTAAKVVHRDDAVFAIEDIRPQAPTHVLVMPIEHIATINDLQPKHSDLVGRMLLVAQQLAAQRGHAESGYRLVFNTNGDALQTIFHIHLHVLGGRTFGWPPG